MDKEETAKEETAKEEMDKYPMAEEYLKEARLQFKIISDAIDTIKMRATHLMSFIGITMAAAVGLRAEAMTEMMAEPGPGTYVELAAMAAMVVSMIRYLGIIKTADMKVPMAPEDMLDESASGCRLNKDCRNWISTKSENYHPTMLRLYLESALNGQRINHDIGRRFNKSTRLFVIGVSVYVLWVLAGDGLLRTLQP